MTADRRRGLESLAREARRRPVSEPDWERLERCLMAAIEREPAAPLAERRTRSLPRLGWLAAGFALSLLSAFVIWRSVSGNASESARTPGQSAEDGVAIGQRFVAHAEPLTVTHPGRASWTLSERGRARVASVGRYLTIELLSGAIDARVARGGQAEAFAIEVGRTRVAVRGTVFRVERRGDRALVTVSEGEVAVGPASSRGTTQAFVLDAPARGNFSLDGRSGTVERNAPGAALVPIEVEPREVAARRDPSAGDAGLALELSIGQIEAGFGRALPALEQCFERHSAAGSGVAVSARSQLSMQIAPDGSVGWLAFNPPLSPPVERCARTRLRELNFARSRRGVTIERNLELGRSAASNP